MGHRGFVELMPFAAVIFASALPELKSRYRVAAIVFGTVFAFVTLEIMCGYWTGSFPFKGGTRRLFWSHIVGKNSLLSFQQKRGPELLPDDAYSASIAAKCLVCPTAPGSPLNVSVTLTNLSNRLWPQEGLALSARFVRVSDGAALSGFDIRIPLETDIAPHEAKQYVIDLKSPADPGEYRLEVDAVHELVTWFSAKGTTRGELPIHVEGAQTGAPEKIQ